MTKTLILTAEVTVADDVSEEQLSKEFSSMLRPVAEAAKSSGTPAIKQAGSLRIETKSSGARPMWTAVTCDWFGK